MGESENDDQCHHGDRLWHKQFGKRAQQQEEGKRVSGMRINP